MPPLVAARIVFPSDEIASRLTKGQKVGQGLPPSPQPPGPALPAGSVLAS
jgi:hypothetical protein